MSKEWLWWLAEFGLAAVVAVVAGIVTKDIPSSILYGLFVGTVFFVLHQNSRVASQFHKEVTELVEKAKKAQQTRDECNKDVAELKTKIMVKKH